jgi:hypothetical protein
LKNTKSWLVVFIRGGFSAAVTSIFAFANAISLLFVGGEPESQNNFEDRGFYCRINYL